MALPLIVAVACLVIYPAFYSMHLATLNKSMTKFVGVGNFEECGGIGDRTVNFLPREDAVRRRARHETSAGVQLGPSWVDRGCRSVESGIGVPDGARGRYRNRLSEGRPRARSPRPGCRWCYWRVPVPKAADGP